MQKSCPRLYRSSLYRGRATAQRKNIKISSNTQAGATAYERSFEHEGEMAEVYVITKENTSV
jgi:hypothetical protein